MTPIEELDKTPPTECWMLICVKNGKFYAYPTEERAKAMAKIIRKATGLKWIIAKVEEPPTDQAKTRRRPGRNEYDPD